jgi:DNA repair protein RadC
MIVQEISVGYNPPKAPKIQIKNGAEAVDYLRGFFENVNFREQFYVMYLDRANQIKGVFHVGTGGIHATSVDQRIIFSVALKGLATGIILCHNHPSGGLKPSDQDLSLTKQIVEAGKILQINVLDHIILTDDSYYSFADNGLM